MCTRRLSLAIFVGAAWLPGQLTSAQEAIALAVQDTYIRHARADTNYGFDAEMLSGNETIENNWRTDALIQFELPPLPGGQQVETAQLELYNHHLEWANRGDADFGVTAVMFEWFEEDDTWNSLDADFADYGDEVYDVVSFEGINPPHGDREDIFPEEWKTWDVTELVSAWYEGTIENNGLAIIGMYNLGVERPGIEGVTFPRFRTKEYLDDESLHPVLNITFGAGQGGPQLQAGDADQDLDFDQIDLVAVQVAAKYLTGQAATWGEGDWNAAPGGAPGNPPAGDGVFDTLDVITALQAGLYLTGPYAALSPGGMVDDGQTSLIYNAGTGSIAVDAPSGTELTSINIDSAAGIFTGEAAANLGGSFDNDADNNIFKATFGGSFGSVSFGNVAQAGLSEDFVLGDLSAVGSLAGGGDLGEVDLVYIPEPSALGLILLGLLMSGLRRCR